jgi:hypothetical protein
VERFNRNVSACQIPFHQAPEILKPVCVNASEVLAQFSLAGMLGYIFVFALHIRECFGASRHAILCGRYSEQGEDTLSRESIIAEIRKDMALMERVIAMLGGVKTVSIDEVVGRPRKPRRKISAAGRRRIAAAQRARWAKIKAAKKK